MNQEVTVSSTIPFYLIKEVENVMNRNRELLLRLMDNKICIDAKGEYLKELQKSFDDARLQSPYAKQYESILLDTVYRRRKTLVLGNDYSEIELCKKSNDKIYLIPGKTKTEAREFSTIHPGVTVCNSESIFDELWVLPFDFKLEEDRNYDLVNILRPFAMNSKTLAIIDPYIHNQRALYQFKKLMSAFEIKNVILKCGDPKKMKTRSGELKETPAFNEFVKELRDKGIKVSFIYYDFYHFDSIGHKERYVLFDDVQVYLPGGLDIFDKNGRFTNTGEGFYMHFRKREIKLQGNPKLSP